MSKLLNSDSIAVGLVIVTFAAIGLWIWYAHGLDCRQAAAELQVRIKECQAMSGAAIYKYNPGCDEWYIAECSVR